MLLAALSWGDISCTVHGASSSCPTVLDSSKPLEALSIVKYIDIDVASVNRYNFALQPWREE